MSKDKKNPFSKENAFKEIVKLKREMKAGNAKNMKEKMAKAIEKYEKMIKDFADKKIKCFSKKVIPVKKMDINFICADQGAHKTIEAALKAALGDSVTCGHVDCQAIQDSVKNGGFASASLEGVKGKLKATDETFEEGKPDFNGNYQVPADKEEFVIFLNNNKQNYSLEFGPEPRQVEKFEGCSMEANSTIIFEKDGGSYYRIKLKSNGHYMRAFKHNTAGFVATVDNLLQDHYRFRVVVNAGGSVSFINKRFKRRVAQISNRVRMAPFDVKQNGERFFLRKSCLEGLKTRKEQVKTRSGGRTVNTQN